ncbi:hypothetical protein PH31N_06753 [Cutibacterium modestum 31N]|nr:hypothetical protein [Cutibacterium modestum 31N]
MDRWSEWVENRQPAVRTSGSEDDVYAGICSSKYGLGVFGTGHLVGSQKSAVQISGMSAIITVFLVQSEMPTRCRSLRPATALTECATATSTDYSTVWETRYALLRGIY